ncbi:MAG: TrkH family potassium uptake protein [Candidatus Brocadiales bacterium]
MTTKVHLISRLLKFLQRSNKILHHFGRKPGISISASFLLIILIGTILLRQPQATVTGEQMRLIDAIFTATSATCVTGLVVKDTAEYFSTFGKVVIMLLIQVGGLSIMTLAAFFTFVIGKRLAISQQAAIKGALDTGYTKEALSLVRFVVVSTFVLESFGCLLLFIHMLPKMPSIKTALFASIFHSISAFCNAGFSIFRNNLVDYQTDLLVNLTITSLIILGGLGFLVLTNLYGLLVSRFNTGHKGRVTLHTKLVLLITAPLLVCGLALFCFFEYNNSLAHLSFPDKLMVSYFQSVTPRTAGFSTVDIGSLTAPSYLLLMFLMFIGGSPGSTAGGIKIVTAGVIVAALYAMLRGKDDVEILGRTIPKRIIQRAVSIVTVSALVVILASMILLYTEKESFEVIIFEIFSAFGTVGLSAGLTPNLTNTGMLLITILMFVGRVGPLTIALAVSMAPPPARIKYPEERVMVG